MKLDWLIYISPRKDTPKKESHQSFRNGGLKQNKLAENFVETYTHVHIYPKPDKFTGNPPTHRYLSYIYMYIYMLLKRVQWSWPFLDTIGLLWKKSSIRTYRKTPTFQR